jgi:hypothetical protein
MQQLELTPTETIILYGFIIGTLEAMRDRGVDNLSQPELTIECMESLRDKMTVILDNIQNNN